MAKLLTKKETAHKLGIHINTLLSWEKQGVMTPRQLGRSQWYTEADINAISTQTNSEKYLTFSVETWQILRNSGEHLHVWTDDQLQKAYETGEPLGVRNGITCYVRRG